MKHGIISQTELGAFTIERRADGFRVVRTDTGVSSGTFPSYKSACDDVKTQQYQTALVKTHGVDGAIEILRGRSSASQSAI
jgi:hypothetical protein